MTTGKAESLPQIVIDAATEVLPLAQHYDAGRFALGLSGSVSKGTSDGLSDLDFRCYSDNPRPAPPPSWQSDWEKLSTRWKERGVVLDELWWRTVADVDRTIDTWLAGTVVPDEMIWTIWGYHPLTDLSRQIPVIDPDNLIEPWRARLHTYPETTRQAILERHLAPLRYWRGDYHYHNKSLRGDEVFLAGLTSLLVHHLLQVLCAVNRVYYPGDGNNLVSAASLANAPADLTDRILQALYPPAAEGRLARQREVVIGLIDDVERILADDSTQPQEKEQ